MRLYSNYIAKSILASVFLVLLIIVAINLLALIIDEVQDIEGAYGFAEMLWFSVCRIPGFMVENIPFACLVGAIAGLGMLASSNELTIIRASGVSIARIVWMVFKPLMVVIVLGISVSQISPGLDRDAKTHRDDLIEQDNASRYLSWNGVWSKEGNSYIRFNNVQPNGRVFGLTRYEFDQNKALISAEFSREANYSNNHWQLKDVEKTRFYPDRTEVERKPEASWETPMSPDVLVLITNDPEDLTLKELWRYIAYLGQEGLDDRKHWLVLWQRLLQPLVIFSLVLVAISFIFGPLRQVTMGSRVFAGVVFGVVFKMVADMLGASSVVFKFDPLLAVLLPVVFCLLLGAYLLRQVR
ncbi:MAG: LPS export ABC transporter permease LptG [Pseudomonadales bacterium]|nr:LPS export ABC transporter permease LptG [Pseudomonadales bacterium]